VVGRTVTDALSRVDTFTDMVASRGETEPDESVLEDAIAFAGVSKYPARVKCALLSWMAFKDATAQAVATSAVRSSTSAVGPGAEGGDR
jgi:nitrogen fixation NifU-like protein